MLQIGRLSRFIRDPIALATCDGLLFSITLPLGLPRCAQIAFNRTAAKRGKYTVR